MSTQKIREAGVNPELVKLIAQQQKKDELRKLNVGATGSDEAKRARDNQSFGVDLPQDAGGTSPDAIIGAHGQAHDLNKANTLASKFYGQTAVNPNQMVKPKAPANVRRQRILNKMMGTPQPPSNYVATKQKLALMAQKKMGMGPRAPGIMDKIKASFANRPKPMAGPTMGQTLSQVGGNVKSALSLPKVPTMNVAGAMNPAQLRQNFKKPVNPMANARAATNAQASQVLGKANPAAYAGAAHKPMARPMPAPVPKPQYKPQGQVPQPGTMDRIKAAVAARRGPFTPPPAAAGGPSAASRVKSRAVPAASPESQDSVQAKPTTATQKPERPMASIIGKSKPKAAAKPKTPKPKMKGEVQEAFLNRIRDLTYQKIVNEAKLSRAQMQAIANLEDIIAGTTKKPKKEVKKKASYKLSADQKQAIDNIKNLAKDKWKKVTKREPAETDYDEHGILRPTSDITKSDKFTPGLNPTQGTFYNYPDENKPQQADEPEPKFTPERIAANRKAALLQAGNTELTRKFKGYNFDAGTTEPEMVGKSSELVKKIPKVTDPIHKVLFHRGENPVTVASRAKEIEKLGPSDTNAEGPKALPASEEANTKANNIMNVVSQLTKLKNAYKQNKHPVTGARIKTLEKQLKDMTPENTPEYDPSEDMPGSGNTYADIATKPHMTTTDDRNQPLGMPARVTLDNDVKSPEAIAQNRRASFEKVIDTSRRSYIHDPKVTPGRVAAEDMRKKLATAALPVPRDIRKTILAGSKPSIIAAGRKANAEHPIGAHADPAKINQTVDKNEEYLKHVMSKEESSPEYNKLSLAPAPRVKRKDHAPRIKALADQDRKAALAKVIAKPAPQRLTPHAALDNVVKKVIQPGYKPPVNNPLDFEARDTHQIDDKGGKSYVGQTLVQKPQVTPQAPKPANMGIPRPVVSRGVMNKVRNSYSAKKPMKPVMDLHPMTPEQRAQKVMRRHLTKATTGVKPPQ